MNKKILLILSLVLVVFFSCKDDEKEDIVVDGVNVENPTFTDKDQDAAQLDVENNAINTVKQFKAMSQDPGMKALLSLSGFFEARQNDNYAINIVKSTAAFNKDNDVTKMMFAMQPKSISQEEDDFISATVTFNFETKEFDTVYNSTNELVIVFPASSNSYYANTNDAKFLVKKPEVDGTKPTFLYFVLTVANDTAVEYSLKAAYNEQDQPTSIESKLSIGEFSFATSLINNSNVISIDYSLSHNKTIVIGYGASIDGDFSQENINKNDTNPENVIKNANAHIQILDIGFVGHISFADFVNEEKKLRPEDYKTEEEALAKMKEMLNNYIKLVVIYADTKKAIGKVIFVPFFDPETGDPDVSLQMQFANGNLVDFNAYMENTVNNLLNGLKALAIEIDTTYGSE